MHQSHTLKSHQSYKTVTPVSCIRHTSKSHLSHKTVTPVTVIRVTHQSHTYHTPKSHLSHTKVTPVTHQSYTCHTSQSHPSHITVITVTPVTHQSHKSTDIQTTTWITSRLMPRLTSYIAHSIQDPNLQKISRQCHNVSKTTASLPPSQPVSIPNLTRCTKKVLIFSTISH